MRLGLIARADNSGLGVQTHEFYRHMHPDKTMVVNISKYNGNKQYPERYMDGMHVYGFPTIDQIDDFLKRLDVVFIAEAAYNPYLYVRARELGIKTAVQYNYEFFDWFNEQMPMPDMFIAPSMWHVNDVGDFVKDYNARTGSDIWHVYLHCPVNRQLLPKRNIQQARTFLHSAGKSAAHDRNGTTTVIEAAQHLKTDARILVHFQGEQGLPHQVTMDLDKYRQYAIANPSDKLELVVDDLESYNDLYAKGDVLLLPRRYGGNCLPMNEALSVGMPVIMTDISPNNNFLPRQWLIPAKKINQFTPRTTIDIYDSSPVALAAKIDEFYRMSEMQMDIENQHAAQLADTISWETMKPKYEHILEKLCTR